MGGMPKGGIIPGLGGKAMTFLFGTNSIESQVLNHLKGQFSKLNRLKSLNTLIGQFVVVRKQTSTDAAVVFRVATLGNILCATH